MKSLQKWYPHLAAFAGFVLVSLVYFYPVLQGKKMYQSDIAQYTGMAKEQNDFRAAHHAEPYWTNSAFGGMPTYQMGAQYPHEYVGMLDHVIRFLPRPADYLFLYFIGFYVLLCVLKIDPLKAFFGALAFGFSTYLIVILGVGHNAKAHAIGYMPMVVAGVIMVFRKRYVSGGLLTMLAAALEINANHFQMTYYLLLSLLLPIMVYYVVRFVRQKAYRPLLYVFGTFALAGLLAVGANAGNLLATAEYTNWSMRGKSELTFNPDGTKNETKSSMKYDYITEYSYGVAESFDLIAPRLFGGSDAEDLGTDSEVYKFAVDRGVPEGQARQLAGSLPAYWGDQPIVAAPAYIGVVVFFLAMMGLFLDRRKIKYAFLAGALMSLFLSWGKNLPALTNFFIDHMPLYDKFRAVSSIQVILELCFPVLAVMGLQAFFREEDMQRRKKALLTVAGGTLGLIVLLFLFKGTFSFEGASDATYAQHYGEDFMRALRSDRATLYAADLLRSGFLVLVSAGVLWFSLRGKLSQQTAVIAVGVVMVGDLYFVDRKYVKADDQTFVSAIHVDQPFQPTQADEMILRDKSIFRVYDVFGRLNGKASYFHKSVGGYSAVRPRRMDQLFDYQIDPQLNTIIRSIDTTDLSLATSHPVLDALNVKYLILQTNDGQDVPLRNPFANGPAWLVSKAVPVTSADAEMRAMGQADLRHQAVVNVSEFADVLKRNPMTGNWDASGSIKVRAYDSNRITYQYSNPGEGFAVFSEMYYPKGWHVLVDGKPATHFRVDYTLRGMLVPAGNHTIEFRFQPDVIKTGGVISLASSVLILLLLAGGLYYENRKQST